MPAQDPAKQLAREIDSLRRQVSSMSRGSQMRYRSLEGGGIPVYDDDGTYRGLVGMLPDGTTGFLTKNGPKPPTPSAVALEPEVGGLRVTYDGTFWEGAEAPGDLKRIEVHASSYSIYEPGPETHRADLIAAGEIFLVLPPDAYTVVLVAVSTSGRRSDPSVPATETPLRAPTYTEVVAANGKNKVFWRRDAQAPTKDTDDLIDGDLWFQKDHDYKPTRWDDELGEWVDARLGDDAVAGLNVGKLTAGEIAAGEAVYFGPRFGTHAEGSATGFRVFRQDQVDGLLDEVIRLGTQTDDYFAVVDRTGNLVASVDDTGAGIFREGHFREEITVQGESLTQRLERLSQPVGSLRLVLPGVARYQGTGTLDQYGPIRSRVGIAEVNGMLEEGHRYAIHWQFAWDADTAGDELEVGVHVKSSTTNDAPAPLVTDPSLEEYRLTATHTWRWTTIAGTAYHTPTVTGRHRFLLAMARGVGSGSMFAIADARFPVTMTIEDLGRAVPFTGQQSQGGGAFYQGAPPPPPPPPTQQYYVDIGTTSRATYRGNGVQRTDTSDVVQGWDPSGYNGDGYGWFGFDNMPAISGTVDRVDLYLYWNHWYYNSGGTAIIAPIQAGNGAALNSLKLRGDWHVSGWPKPGGVWVTVPSDWFTLFRAGTAYGIGLGPSGGSNLTYYGRASDCRLRIWYTQ